MLWTGPHARRAALAALLAGHTLSCSGAAAPIDAGADSARPDVAADTATPDAPTTGDDGVTGDDVVTDDDAPLDLDATSTDDATVDDATSTDDAAARDASTGFEFPTPIHYVVVIVKENHTFDNYFTGFPGAETTMVAHQVGRGTIARQPAPNADLFDDLPHFHRPALGAWNRGQMNDFMLSGAPAAAPANWREAPFLYYPEAQIPNYWALARRYALFDHFFSTALAPSEPGHVAVIAAQTPILDDGNCNAPGNDCSNRCRDTTSPPVTYERYSTSTCATFSRAQSCFAIPAVPMVLPRGITWRTYGRGSGHSIVTPFVHIRGIDDDAATVATHYWPLDQFSADARGGRTLANVSFLAAFGGALTEHPPSHPCIGENATIDVINAVMAGPHWRETAIIVTWDDWGGWYDHVAPASESCGPNEHFTPGFRLPAIVISPWTRPGVVVHTVTEHASIARLIEDLFTPPGAVPRRLHDMSPTARDAAAGSMMGAFDFTTGRRLVPDVHLTTHHCAANGGVPGA